MKKKKKVSKTKKEDDFLGLQVVTDDEGKGVYAYSIRFYLQSPAEIIEINTVDGSTRRIQ